MTDSGKLNLNRLSLMGVGVGASVAANWAAKDWSMPPLAVGKQGQDVKALVLISPRWKNRGLLMHQALRQPGLQRNVGVMLIYGREDRRVTADVRRIYKQLERYHPEPESRNTDNPLDLLALGSDTSLQGKELLRTLGDQGETRIIDFLRIHVSEEDYEWSKREPDF